MRRYRLIAALGLLLLHVLPFAMRPVILCGDQPHYALMAHSLAVDGDLDLTREYEEVALGSKAAGKRQAGNTMDRHLVGERQVFAHPLGLPALVAPVLWLQQRLAPGAAPDVLLGLVSLGVTGAALAAAWRALSRSGLDRRHGATALLLLYFTTPLWYYSRTFFTEPFLWAFVVLALSFLAGDRWILASLFLGLSFLMKETAALILGPVLLYAGHRFGVRRAALLSLGPVLALALFCAKNLWVCGAAFVTFQPFQMGDPLRGLAGVLLDPSCGLVYFAPLVVVAGLGWLPGIRGGVLGLERLYSLLAFAGYLAVVACWVDWHGGTSYGPRLLVPILPAFFFPLLQVLRLGRWAGWPLGLVSFGGFLVQWCAAVNPLVALRAIPIGEFLSRRPLDLVVGTLVFAGVLAALRASRRPGSRRKGPTTPDGTVAVSCDAGCR